MRGNIRAGISEMDAKINFFAKFTSAFIDLFGGQKSRFLDFFIVMLELLKKCLSIVLGLIWPTFCCIFSSKVS